MTRFAIVAVDIAGAERTLALTAIRGFAIELADAMCERAWRTGRATTYGVARLDNVKEDES